MFDLIPKSTYSLVFFYSNSLGVENLRCQTIHFLGAKLENYCVNCKFHLVVLGFYGCCNKMLAVGGVIAQSIDLACITPRFDP